MKRTLALVILASHVVTNPIECLQNKKPQTSHSANYYSEQQEREILLQNCRILASRARAQANGCRSHLIGLYITQYLQTVGTPTALQLLQELSANQFNDF
jgi:hypothetical protein